LFKILTDVCSSISITRTTNCVCAGCYLHSRGSHLVTFFVAIAEKDKVEKDFTGLVYVMES
jgi:hypothetical protein